MKDWAEITENGGWICLNVWFSPLQANSLLEKSSRIIFVKFFSKPLNAAHRQLQLKLVAPFHQFSSWQSRRLELVAMLYGMRARPFRLIRYNTNKH